jgi:hypothetical protein
MDWHLIAAEQDSDEDCLAKEGIEYPFGFGEEGALFVTNNS